MPDARRRGGNPLHAHPDCQTLESNAPRCDPGRSHCETVKAGRSPTAPRNAVCTLAHHTSLEAPVNTEIESAASSTSPAIPRGQRLSAATTALEATLPPRLPELAGMTFRHDSRDYVCAAGPYSISARLDLIRQAWIVSASTAGWSSGDHRCPGCAEVTEALAWGATLLPRDAGRGPAAPVDAANFAPSY